HRPRRVVRQQGPDVRPGSGQRAAGDRISGGRRRAVFVVGAAGSCVSLRRSVIGAPRSQGSRGVATHVPIATAALVFIGYAVARRDDLELLGVLESLVEPPVPG